MPEYRPIRQSLTTVIRPGLAAMAICLVLASASLAASSPEATVGPDRISSVLGVAALDETPQPPFGLVTATCPTCASNPGVCSCAGDATARSNPGLASPNHVELGTLLDRATPAATTPVRARKLSSILTGRRHIRHQAQEPQPLD